MRSRLRARQISFSALVEQSSDTHRNHVDAHQLPCSSHQIRSGAPFDGRTSRNHLRSHPVASYSLASSLGVAPWTAGTVAMRRFAPRKVGQPRRPSSLLGTGAGPSAGAPLAIAGQGFAKENSSLSVRARWRVPIRGKRHQRGNTASRWLNLLWWIRRRRQRVLVWEGFRRPRAYTMAPERHQEARFAIRGTREGGNRRDPFRLHRSRTWTFASSRFSPMLEVLARSTG